MGRVRQVESTLKLSICKKGKSDAEERNNYQNRVIENKICLWVGSTGCLSSDTILFGQSKTLEQLYNQDKRFIKTFSMGMSGNKYSYPTKSKSEIVFSGEREVYEIELENGKKVIATKEHRFFVRNSGIKETKLSDLKVGDKIICYPESYITNYHEFVKKSQNMYYHKKKIDPGKLCEKCNVPFYKEKRQEKFRTCKNCRIYDFGFSKKHYWFEWEKQVIRNFYYGFTKEYISSLLPNRSWSSIIHMAIKLSIKRNPKFSNEKNRWSSTNNPMFDPKLRKKSSISHRKLYLKHPEKLPNSRLRRNNMTNIEKKIANLLDDLNIKYDWNKYIRTRTTFRFPDFKIGNLIIECDGIYWHKKNVEDDKKRENELKELGFEIIRFDDKEILKDFDNVKKCIIQKLNL